MQTKKNHTARLASLLAVTLGTFAASTAIAAPTAWDTPAGDQGTYSYSGGQTQNNKIGSPFTTSTGFFFAPSNLSATAVGSMESFSPGSSSSSDVLSVILNAKPATQFGSISGLMIGDFSTSGLASVNATGQLRVFNLDNLAAGPQVMDLDFGSSFGNVPMFASAQGEFSGTAALALPPGWTNIRVELDGLVSADAMFGSSAIQAKGIEIGVETAPLGNTTEVPLPAAAFAAPLAAAIAYKARRRFMKR